MNDKEKLFSGADNEECLLGEFGIFPTWLFTERHDAAMFVIAAYGADGRAVCHRSPSREFALAECVREILNPNISVKER
jgi:hypothetical protein